MLTAHGLALSIAVNPFGGVSGAHFNPEVTSVFLVTSGIKPTMAFSYIVSQLLGVTAVAGLCRVVSRRGSLNHHLGLPLPAAWASMGVVPLTEFILTYLLMTSIFWTAVDERGKVVKIGGFGIGLTVAFDILVGGALSGASMNPARSLWTGGRVAVPRLALALLDGADRRGLRRRARLRASDTGARAGLVRRRFSSLARMPRC